MGGENRAEMIGNGMKVVAKPGDTLAVGDTLVILESLKMEIPAPAEVGGRLAGVAVRVGDTVQQGDVLGVVE